MGIGYYDPWVLGRLTEHITLALTEIEKLDKSEKYVVTTNEVLTESQNSNKPITEVNWEEFYEKHQHYTLAENLKPTDSIIMSAEGEETNKEWKWCKYGDSASSMRSINNFEFIQWIQHDSKVLVVTSVSTGIRKYFRNGEVVEIQNNGR